MAVSFPASYPSPTPRATLVGGNLVREGRDLERQVLTRAVRPHLQRRVLVDGRRTIVFG
jgi:formyltetrahydrofolate hydrolase